MSETEPGPRKPPGGRRRHVGGDDDLIELPAGAPGVLLIDTGVPRAHWQARVPGDQIHPPHPGTPLVIGRRVYEIVRSDVEVGPPRRVHYLLEPWDERFPLRQPVRYDAAECEKALADLRRARRDRQRSRWLRRLGLVVSLLPARDQRRLESHDGFPAVTYTLASAGVLWATASGLAVLSIGLAMAPDVPPELAWVPEGAPLYWYFFLESAVRFASAWKVEEPMGSLPVVLPLQLYRALRGAWAPQERQRRSIRRATRHRPASEYAKARDEVRKLGDAPSRLEILSLLPKDHWTVNHTAVRYGDLWYLVTRRDEIGGGEGLRHRFVLEEYQEDLLPRYSLEYRPEEVQDIHRARMRREKGTWVGTFAPLWGFLDPEMQRGLEARFEYDALQSTRHSTVVGVIFGATATFTAFGYVGAGEGGLLDVAVLVTGLYLLVESLVRWTKARREELSGGLLGRVIAPLARRLLE